MQQKGDTIFFLSEEQVVHRMACDVFVTGKVEKLAYYLITKISQMCLGFTSSVVQ